MAAAAVNIFSGYPTRFVEAIGTDGSPDKNDFPVFFKWNGGVGGFNETDIEVTDDIVGSDPSLVSFEKISDSAYEAIIRPSDNGTGTITVRVRSNAVSVGNAATQANFAFTDTVAAEVLFNYVTALGYSGTAQPGIVVEGSRIKLLLGNDLYVLDAAGNRLRSEDRTNIIAGTHLNLINDRYYTNGQRLYVGGASPENFSVIDWGVSIPGVAPYNHLSALRRSLALNRWGLFGNASYHHHADRVSFDGVLSLSRENETRVITYSEGDNTYNLQRDALSRGSVGRVFLSHGDRIYQVGGNNLLVYRAISDTAAAAVRTEDILNLRMPTDGDAAVYGKWLYFRSTTAAGVLRRVNLSHYRPPEVRKNIVPQILTEGERLNLRMFVEGAETILFETDYDVPGYLSIDSNFNLVTADGQITEDTVILVKLRAFNRRYDVPFAFYIVIRKKKTPVAKDVKVLPLDNGETYDLRKLFDGADRVDWKSGFSVPNGFSIAESKLTVTGQTSEIPTEIQLTGTNPQGSTGLTTDVIVRTTSVIRNTSESFVHRVLIEGIEIPDEDLLEIPNIHHGLDVIHPNEFISDQATFVFSSDRGKYDSRVDGNFWESNNLNKNGYLSAIELWVDSFDTGSRQSKLQFQGVIQEVNSGINAVIATLNCVSLAYLLKNTPLTEIGLEKYANLNAVGETYQGEYAPDAGLLPILRKSASVFSGAAQVPISTYRHAPEATPAADVASLTDSRVLTRGGYLSELPVLKFQTPYQRRRIDFLMQAFAAASGFHNPKIALNTAYVAAEPHLASRGNVAFNIEETKTVRTVVDWIHDATNDIFYFLLSHPSRYIQDLLVSYDAATDTYAVVKKIDDGLQVAQLASVDFENFYIIATTATDFDRIESPSPPNYNASVFDNLDASRETQDTRILKYVRSTDTLGTFVGVNASAPVQIGLHYMAGFENPRHIHWREGIFAETRSKFRIHNNQLYYRFAKWGSFGVARATASGTTSVLLSENTDPYFNALNFDFDIAENGDVFMLSSTGSHTQSTLKVKKYDAATGSTETVFSQTRDLADLREIDETGGAWLGCHEVKLHNDRLYCVLPIQRVSENDDGDVVRDIRKSAGAVFGFIHVASRYMEVLKRYDYVQLSCRSLTVHDNHLYFAEYPNASTHFEPVNPDLEDYDAGAYRNTVPPNKIWLKRVSGDAEIADVVSPWYVGEPFNATAVPMLSDGETLHAMVRYADRFDISAVDSEASNPANEQWVTFGRSISFHVENGFLGGSVHDAMVALAKLGNARLQIVANRLRFEDVDPYEALLSTGLSDAVSQLNYKGANKELPASGHVLIGKEIIAYQNRTAARLSGLTRGVGGTQAVAHKAGDRILFVDKVIEVSPLNNPYEDIHIRIDTNKFYNVVRDGNRTAEARDSDSIETYGVREFVNDLNLSDHQIAWQQWIHAKTLNRLRDIRSSLRIRMQAAVYLDIGDIVYFDYADEISMPIQIIDIQDTQTSEDPPKYFTDIIGQEVLPLPRVSFGDATIGDMTFAQYCPSDPVTMPKAADHKESYVYRMEGLPSGMHFDPETRIRSGTPIFVQSASEIRYSVVDADNPTWEDVLTANYTVVAMPLGFVGTVKNFLFQKGVDIGRVPFPPARGGTGEIDYTPYTVAARLGIRRDGTGDARCTERESGCNRRDLHRYGCE